MISNSYLFETVIGELKEGLKEYLFSNIVPLYYKFDKAHDKKHAMEVLNFSLKIANLRKEKLDPNLLYANALYHDVGLMVNREEHEIHSSKYVLADKNLHRWFSKEEIQLIANSCIEHRSSSKRRPKTIYGMILSDADSSGSFNINRLMERTWNYRKSLFPNQTKEDRFEEMYDHVQRKFCKGGYIEMWLPETKQMLKYDLAQLDRCCQNKKLTINILNKMLKSGQLS